MNIKERFFFSLFDNRKGQGHLYFFKGFLSLFKIINGWFAYELALDVVIGPIKLQLFYI